jgi:tight adherence protein B
MGGGTTLIALVILAMLSAGGLAYALLYGRINASERDKRLEHIRARRTGISAGEARSEDAANRRRKTIQESLEELDAKQKAKAKSARPPLKTRMEQAGLNWSKRTFYLVSAGIGILVLFLAWIVGLPWWAAMVFGLSGLLAVPRWLVSYLRKRRFKKFLMEFPNAVDVIVRGIKAGLPLNDCMKIIANEAAEPVKGEFKIVNEEQTLGLSLPDAVARLPDRVPLPETSFFSIVITIQSKTGGNLSEALGNLSRVLRERKKMKDKIRAMSAEARASAFIIGVLPLVVIALVYLSSPGYIMLLFQTTIGNVILACATVWAGIGVLVMRRMVNFDY